MIGPESVSVIVPAHNTERYVVEAIDSVLGQTSPAAEVLVIDDGSSDRTAERASAFGDKVACIRRAPEGLASAFNAGLAHTEGELVASIDADDLWTPRKLALQLAALARDPGIDLVFGHVEQFLSPDLSQPERARIRLRAGSAPGLTRGTMLARRSAFQRVGKFERRWRLGEFMDWYARAQEAGLTTVMLPEVLMRRRLHAANSASRREDHADYPRVLAEMLKRRGSRPSSQPR